MGAIEQPGVEMLFQLADLKGDRGLGHMQRLRRFGEAQQAGDGMENLESSVGHFKAS